MRALNNEERRYLEELAQKIERLSKGSKGELIASAASFLNCSKDRIYKGLREVGWVSGRSRRSDCGSSKVGDGEAKIIATLVAESRRANGKKLLPLGTAMEIGNANGLISTKASKTTYSRVMRAAGCHPEQLNRPTPHTAMRSLHPNHVWQFDVSVCVLYYLADGGLSVMDEKKFYKNKPKSFEGIKNKRVLRYLVTDHFTGTLFVRYYLAAGEDQPTLFNFLMEAFAKRQNPKDPFHGVPWMMVWDAGSANQSYMIRNLLDNLQVKHWAHEPGRPRAKGQVESTHNIVECNFEGVLYLQKVQNIDELNIAADKWQLHYNANKIHSRTETSRYGLWQTIRAEQLRICPPRELCEQLLNTKPETRTVKGNLVISFVIKGYPKAHYSVEHVPGVRVGEQVKVCVNPYRAPNIFVIVKDEYGTEKSYEAEPIVRDAAGFYIGAPVFGENYASTRDTDTDQLRKQMAKEAYGAETPQEVDKAKAKRIPAFGGAIDPFSYLEKETSLHFMERPGTALHLPQMSVPEFKPLSIVEALKRLRVQINRALTPTENTAIRARYPDGIPEDQLDQLAAWLAGSSEPEARMLCSTT